MPAPVRSAAQAVAVAAAWTLVAAAVWSVVGVAAAANTTVPLPPPSRTLPYGLSPAVALRTGVSAAGQAPPFAPGDIVPVCSNGTACAAQSPYNPNTAVVPCTALYGGEPARVRPCPHPAASNSLIRPVAARNRGGGGASLFPKKGHRHLSTAPSTTTAP